MVKQMVRKQFYILKHQDVMLKRIAEARGVSEAEIIRQAIDREVTGETTFYRVNALDGITDFAGLALSKRNETTEGQPFRWDRDEIYAERENRWLREEPDS